jgi:hypothetical protein
MAQRGPADAGRWADQPTIKVTRMKKRSSPFDTKINLLTEFREAVLKWFHGKYEQREKEALRAYINRNLIAARTAVKDVGALKSIVIGPPPAIGGLVVENPDPFSMLFDNPYGLSVIPCVADMIDEAIGVYEHLRDETGLVRLVSREAIDIEAAIERALRPYFRKGPPASEKEVQDAIEVILNSLGIDFTREQESAPVGPRSFIPDFCIANLDLAIEIKLAKPKHTASKIQEELAADISAYRTKWKHILVVIYDNGVISDPYKMRQENIKHFGVSVVIIKH